MRTGNEMVGGVTGKEQRHKTGGSPVRLPHRGIALPLGAPRVIAVGLASATRMLRNPRPRRLLCGVPAEFCLLPRAGHGLCSRPLLFLKGIVAEGGPCGCSQWRLGHQLTPGDPPHHVWGLQLGGMPLPREPCPGCARGAASRVVRGAGRWPGVLRVRVLGCGEHRPGSRGRGVIKREAENVRVCVCAPVCLCVYP